MTVDDRSVGHAQLSAPTARPIYAWYVLAVLTVVTLFAYVDRSIFALLAQLIKTDMRLSDLQLGLLQGTGIALFAGLASYPLGWLADRYDRRLVLAGCILVWSTAVMLCGTATSFLGLFAAGALVGAGEAGLVPVAVSLIPDLFDRQRRQLANSIFALAAASAGGLAYAIGGQIPGLVEVVRPQLPVSLQALETWRLSFFAAAAPAPLMIALILFSGSATRQRGHDSTQPRPAMPPILPHLRQHARTFVPYLSGMTIAAFGFAAIYGWMAVIIMRQFGQSAAQTGAAISQLVLSGLAAGFVLSIVLTRLFARRVGVAFPIRVLWLSYAATAVFIVPQLFVTTVGQLYLLGFAQVALLTTTTMLAPTAIQSMAPRKLRARLVATLAVFTLGASATAGPAVGLLSDLLQSLPNALMVAAVSLSASSMLLSTLLLRLAERHFPATVAANDEIDRFEAARGAPASDMVPA